MIIDGILLHEGKADGLDGYRDTRFAFAALPKGELRQQKLSITLHRTEETSDY